MEIDKGNAARTAFDSWEPDAAGGEQPGPGLARVLRALSSEARLAIVRCLAVGHVEPAAIARELGMPPVAVRRHLGALADVGLVRKASRGAADVYSLQHHAAGFLSTSLVYGVSGGTLPARTEDSASRPAVPRPPPGCSLCDNAAFVNSVLDDLSAALDETRLYHGRIQEMSSRVLTAHEEERKRIARELHDDTAQAITSILVRLRLLAHSLPDETVQKDVEELRELTSDALDSVRRMAMDLRPASLDDLGLVPALETYAGRFSESSGIAVSLKAQGLGRRLPRDVELVLYRVFQEALTNVAKHASAKTVKVTIKRRHNEVTLIIEDDGRGFDSERTNGSQSSGLGLFGMRERLSLVGGVAEIESNEGSGCRIIARVPLARKALAK